MHHAPRRMTDLVLAKNILATIAYYDVLDFPMTSFEVWRHLIRHVDGAQTWSHEDVESALRAQEVRDFAATKDGVYFLHGREELVDTRGIRELISIEKIKKLRRYMRTLRAVPFVRMITLTGRLSYKNGDENSDLDVLVAFKDGHIWTGRFLFTLVTHIMGVRRYGAYHADRVCLNYYVSDEHLTVPTQDLYGAHEYSFIVPMYGRELFQQFVKANDWVKKYRPHYMTENIENLWTLPDNRFLAALRRVGECIFGLQALENIAREKQTAKIMHNPKTHLPGACIIANDKHLVFLPKPHGPRVYEEYRKRFEALEIPWRTS